MTRHPSRKTVVRVAGYKEEFLGNGCTDSDENVLENAYLIGRPKHSGTICRPSDSGGQSLT